MKLPKGIPSGGALKASLNKARMPAAIGFGILLLLTGGYFGYQFYEDSQKEARAAKQTSTIQRFAQTTVANVKDAVAPLLKAVNGDEIRGLLTQADADGLAAKAKELAASSPDVMGVRFLKPGIDETNYDYFPPVSYAVLDLLRQAQERNNPPGYELHFKGEEQENIAVLHPLKSAESEAFGYMLVAVSPQVLKSAALSANVSFGYVELQQPRSKGRSLVLTGAGNPSYRVGVPTLSQAIPGTAWSLAFWSQARKAKPESGTLGVPLLPVGAGALVLLAAGGLLVFRRRRAAAAAAPMPGPTAGVAAVTAATKTDPENAAAGPGVAALPAEDTGQAAEGAESAAQLPASIFRAYDIRGIVGQGLSAANVTLIGRAIGSEAAALGQKTIVVGRDGRNSSEKLAQALIEGLQAAGRDVIDVGRVPTPLVYFATHYLETGSGVMVTGSHNPPEYNGLKIMLAGETLFGDRIAALKTRAEAGELASGSGELQTMDVVSEYIRRVSDDIPVALGSAFKVVIDCGNGVAGEVAPQLIRSLGHDVVELFCEVDGNFPNHHPDPSQPANLKDLIQSVKENSADIGFAFDGDGDRLGVVDANGRIIYPDRQMMLFARDVLSRNPGAEIVFDVKCSSRLPKVIKKLGGKPVMWKTGHSFIKSKLKETGAPLAGEMSGHIFFKERWYGFDDALYAAARMLEILMSFKQPPAEIFKKLPTGVSTPELKIDLPESQHQTFMQQFESSGSFGGGTLTTIDGVRVDYPDGWGLVRPSNTTPSLILRFEGDDKEALKRIAASFKETILGINPDLKLPF